MPNMAEVSTLELLVSSIEVTRFIHLSFWDMRHIYRSVPVVLKQMFSSLRSILESGLILSLLLNRIFLESKDEHYAN